VPLIYPASRVAGRAVRHGEFAVVRQLTAAIDVGSWRGTEVLDHVALFSEKEDVRL
jgi:hypothetical protein